MVDILSYVSDSNDNWYLVSIFMRLKNLTSYLLGDSDLFINNWNAIATNLI